MIVQTTFDQVKAFTVKFTGVKSVKVVLDTTLEHDLGITGDDGEDFMWAFFTEFSVDYSGFDSAKYFAQEGFDFIGLTLVIRNLFTNLPPLTSPTHDITIADLVKAFDENRWIDLVA